MATHFISTLHLSWCYADVCNINEVTGILMYISQVLCQLIVQEGYIDKFLSHLLQQTCSFILTCDKN